MVRVDREVLGVGIGAALPCDAELTFPALHPIGSPGFLLDLDTVDGVVVRADVEVGLMHRSAEKLFEARDYRQAMMLANRHDWLSSACAETTVAMAVESALGLAPPERANWLRTLLIEGQSAKAALAFLAPIAGSAGMAASSVLERLTDAQEFLTGARVHPGFVRIGGVAHPASDTALDAYSSAAAAATAIVGELADVVGAGARSHTGLAQLSRDEALGLGVSGIVARASGLDLDLRRDDPALAYGALADSLDAQVLGDGDVPARLALLADQVRVSARLVAECAARLRSLGDGPIDVRLPKVVRLPEGSTYAWLEGGLGIAGVLLVSTGEKTPWRMKIRSASFANMQAMVAALPGVPRSELVAAITSFPIVMGDVDR